MGWQVDDANGGRLMMPNQIEPIVQKCLFPPHGSSKITPSIYWRKHMGGGDWLLRGVGC
jgi:hypothetical protein